MNREEPWDDWEEDEKVEILCLFCEKLFPTPEDCFVHCAEEHSFDFAKVSKDWGKILAFK